MPTDTKKRINSRGKGSEGEREFARWLQEKLELDFLPQRNLEQSRGGGADIIDVRPFLFEVKRCEVLAFRDWWLQVIVASKKTIESVPIVAYRQNKQPWRFLISAKNIGLRVGYIQLEENEAIQWMRIVLNTDNFA